MDSSGRSEGVSAVEAIVTLAVVVTVAAYAAPGFVGWRQEQELEAAARHFARLVSRTCAAAVASGRTHAIRFHPGRELSWEVVTDGDGDGVRTSDVDAGIDIPVEPSSSLRWLFPGVEAGRPAGVATVAGGAADRGGLAFGGSELVSCSPRGGARAGTLYLRSRSGGAAALRIYGPTARTTLWWWRGRPGRWAELR